MRKNPNPWYRMQNLPVLTQLAALKNMNTEQLKKKWREICEGEPPPFNRAYLETRIAYRIQELANGGLKKHTLRRINDLREDFLSDTPRQRIDPNKPPLGSILVREFKGVEYRVRVVRDGFEFEGKPYKSLSVIARQITGSRWNGPLFFGLRTQRNKQ